jgi:zinc transport system substrate-binding protein
MILMRMIRRSGRPRTSSRTFVAVAAALTVPLLAGCGALGATDDDGRPSVVASFYPLAYVAERVAGPNATVSNLTTPGKEPHDLELTVAQTAEVADAEVAIYEHGLQPAVDDAIEQADPPHVVETTALSPLHGDDPHFWLDPERLSRVAAAFADQLSAADPAHEAAYTANLHDLQDDLAAIDDAYRTGLAACALDTVVVSHDAFEYWSKYGLHFAAINGLSPDAEPSPAHLAQLHDLIEEHQITTVFSETLASPELADSLAHDLGVKTAVLDPIEGLGDATADEDYLSLMRANLAALREANRCR